MHPAAIILAGGESRRMGVPKALLEYRGETFAARLVRVFATVATPVLLVTGAYPETAVAGAQTVFNSSWRAGQLSSLQAGIRALPTDTSAFFFAPVDCPAFEPSTVRALWSAFEKNGALFTIPRMDDRRGHPVLVARAAAGQFLALDPGGQAREVVHRYRDRTHYVDVDDSGIFADVDTPEAYRELRQRTG